MGTGNKPSGRNSRRSAELDEMECVNGVESDLVSFQVERLRYRRICVECGVVWCGELHSLPTSILPLQALENRSSASPFQSSQSPYVHVHLTKLKHCTSFDQHSTMAFHRARNQKRHATSPSTDCIFPTSICSIFLYVKPKK